MQLVHSAISKNDILYFVAIMFFVDNAKKISSIVQLLIFHRNRSQLIEKLLRDSFFKNMFVVNQ